MHADRNLKMRLTRYEYTMSRFLSAINESGGVSGTARIGCQSALLEPLSPTRGVLNIRDECVELYIGTVLSNVSELAIFV